MKIKPILIDRFYHDGRGPLLQKVHYSQTGSTIVAVDYFNPDDDHSPQSLKHLLFVGAQAFMFTPEEVASGSSSVLSKGSYGRAAIISLGKSEWLNSFLSEHLIQCQHFHLMFYDEYLVVICEEIDARLGGYIAA